MSTVRTLGAPEASTVATEIAVGSGTSGRSCDAATAASTQALACAYGESATSDSTSPSPV